MQNFFIVRLFKWAENLRFPVLFIITSFMFLLSFVVIDPIPFLDEIAFGLLALLFAKLKNKKSSNPTNNTNTNIIDGEYSTVNIKDPSFNKKK